MIGWSTHISVIDLSVTYSWRPSIRNRIESDPQCHSPKGMITSARPLPSRSTWRRTPSCPPGVDPIWCTPPKVFNFDHGTTRRQGLFDHRCEPRYRRGHSQASRPPWGAGRRQLHEQRRRGARGRRGDRVGGGPGRGGSGRRPGSCPGSAPCRWPRSCRPGRTSRSGRACGRDRRRSPRPR